MLRNFVLFMASAGVLVGAYFGVQTLFPAPVVEEAPERVANLPDTRQVADEQKVVVGPLAIEPGERVGTVRYDEYGRPTDGIYFESWRKLPDNPDEILIVRPLLILRMPSGMTARISADEGQVTVEQQSSEELRPKFGTLRGNAQILLDRNTAWDRPPLSERPEDQVTIAAEQFSFDIERGEVSSAGALELESAEFALRGAGLDLVWNEPENRVERLVIERGRELVLAGELLSSTNGAFGQAETESAAPRGDAAVTQPATQPNVRVIETNEPVSYQAYRCVLHDGVVAEQREDGVVVGSLAADEFELVVDLPRRELRDVVDRRRVTTQPDDPSSATTQPTATQSATAPDAFSTPDAPTTQATPVQRELVVRWNGRFELRPTEATVRGPARRHFIARGDEVAIDSANARIRCGGLRYFDEHQRLWLDPRPNGTVSIDALPRLAVVAQNVYADLRERVVKLTGPVDVDGAWQPGPQGASRLRATAQLWAELHLRADDEVDAGGEMIGGGAVTRTPERVVLVGDTDVAAEDWRVRSWRFEAEFQPPLEAVANAAADAGSAVAGSTAASNATQPAEATAESRAAPQPPAMLKSIVASGDVRVFDLSGDGPRVVRALRRQGELVARAALRGVFPRLRERLALQPPRHKRTLACTTFSLTFGIGEATPERLDARGAVRLLDRATHIEATGERLAVDFADQQQVRTARMHGDAGTPARIRSAAYVVRGQLIKVDNDQRVLTVPGPAELLLAARRSLHGRRSEAIRPIRITCRDELAVLDRQNQLRFFGEVVASAGDEQLLADYLQADLVEIEEAPAEAADRVRIDDAFGRLLRGALPERGAAERAALASQTAGLAIVPAAQTISGRRDLGRIYARNALIKSEVFVEGDPEPLVHQSVSGPELIIDVSARVIRTVGRTVLAMIDRRLPERAPQRPAANDPMSALMSAGPSQMALECNDSLVYALGDDAEERTDSMLLSGGVRFRYVTGSELVALERMLPAGTDRSLLEQLPSRNTYLECTQLDGKFAARALGTAGGMGAVPSSLALKWLSARGDVFLEDKLGEQKRTVYAEQVQFDRARKLLRILGDAARGTLARVFDENLATGRADRPVTAPEITIDLENNTIRGRDMRGRIGG